MRKSQQQGRKHKNKLYDLTIERMEILYNISKEETIKGNYEYASKLNELIIRISLKNKVKIPREIKRSICKNCHVTLIPGITSTVRLRSQGRMKYRIVKCKLCGYIKRYPY